MAQIGGPPPDALALIVTGMFWLAPVMLDQLIPTALEQGLIVIEYGLGSAGILGGLAMTVMDEL